jgi:primosomal protein N' (replication factor Y)
VIDAPAVCAEVLLDLPARRVDRRLAYRIPASLEPEVRVGSVVSVPLGSRTARGFVIAVGAPPPSVRPLREILAVAGPPLFSASMLGLARDVAEHTLSTLLEAVHCLAPPAAFRPRRPRPAPAVAALAANGAAPVRPGARQARILDVLRAQGAVPVDELLRNGGRPALRRLVARGVVVLRPAHIPGPPASVSPPAASPPPGSVPSPASAPPACAPPPAAAEPETCVWGGAGGRWPWIAEAVRAAVAGGGRALVIVPEIARVGAFARALAPEFARAVVTYHSGMTGAERQAAWARCAAQQAAVVIGTRSALFAPLRDVRLIAVDDEHDPAHQGDAAPRYHARDVAGRRARLDGARLVLASATPSVETYARVAANELACVRLAPETPRRVRLVDMRGERARGRYGLLAEPLVAAIRRHLRARGRVVLFVNRTGYARVLLCDECGAAVRCAACGVTMPYDAERRQVCCRLCGAAAPAPGTCPHCGGVRLRGLGPGTARVEEVVRRVFPALRVARLDRETAPAFSAVARDFEAGRLRLIVGTQILLRARDLRPSLVGVVDADLALHRPDFRGAERTLQQLRAVAALAAGVPEGEAIVQTRVPDHPAVRAVATGEDERAYRSELALRRALRYPPYAALARVVAAAAARDAAAGGAARVVAVARACGVEALGPAPGRESGRRGVFRFQCLLRAGDEAALRAAARAAVADAARAAAQLTVEINPQEFD